jgi:putative ABC transport system permease protein
MYIRNKNKSIVTKLCAIWDGQVSLGDILRYVNGFFSHEKQFNSVTKNSLQPKKTLNVIHSKKRLLFPFSLHDITHGINRLFVTELFFSDILSIIYQRFLTKKLRFILTVLGISVGIAAVYFLVSLTFGIQQLVIGNIANDESLLSLDVVPNTEITDFVVLNDKMLDRIKKINGVEYVSPAKSLPTEMTLNKVKTQTLVYGVEQSYFRLSSIKATTGDLFTDDSQDKAVISSALLALFNIDAKKAIGTKFRLNLIYTPPADITSEKLSAKTATLSATVTPAPKVQSIVIPKQFTIVGVVNDETDYVYIHRDNFKVVDFDEYKTVKLKVRSQADVEPVRGKILSLGFMVSALTDTLRQINQIFQATQLTFTIIGIVSLFIAAIGMFNTMTISLLERTREIGIMKAIGSTEKAVQQMFLAESIMMGIAGGLGGIIIGFVITNIFNILVNMLALTLGGQWVYLFYTPPWFLGLIIVFSIVIGFLTGYIPARRAARMNPLDALRYE